MVKKIAEKFNHLSRVTNVTDRQTTNRRQTDRRQTELRLQVANVNASSRLLKTSNCKHLHLLTKTVGIVEQLQNRQHARKTPNTVITKESGSRAGGTNEETEEDEKGERKSKAER